MGFLIGIQGSLVCCGFLVVVVVVVVEVVVVVVVVFKVGKIELYSRSCDSIRTKILKYDELM